MFIYQRVLIVKWLFFMATRLPLATENSQVFAAPRYKDWEVQKGDSSFPEFNPYRLKDIFKPHPTRGFHRIEPNFFKCGYHLAKLLYFTNLN